MSKYFQAPWDVKDIFLSILITAFFLSISVFTVHFYKIDRLIESSDLRTIILLTLLILQWFIMLAPILFITFKKYKIKLKSFGIEHIGVWQTIKNVLIGYLTFILVSIIINIFILYTNIKIPGYQIQEKILPLFSDDILSLISAGFFIVILAPIVEEILFRGIILRSLINKWGIWIGSLSTALLFALFHTQWQSIIPIFILGLIINTIVIRSRSIVPAILFHIINNLIAFTVEILLIKEIITLEDIV